MSKRTERHHTALGCLLALVLAWPALGSAQEDIPLLSAEELSELVGPIALYPDDLLAIVLPASTYPLQLVQADRFIQDLKSDATLEPDEDWDDAVVALLNYPEVIELLVKDLDQTWRLGEAVVAQQADVIDAVEAFRDRAYAAGNLQSDDRQTVSQNDGVIEIAPVAEDVIYVPYYEPERVVVYQPQPVYHYYPRPYPVYYYPYPSGYAFNYGYFWGVTTAFTVGWFSDSLHVYHHSYYGHPYYGHSYWHNHWYRHHSVHVHNNYYYDNHGHHGHNHHSHGDYWRPHSRSTVSHSDQRVTRNRHYPGSTPNDAHGARSSQTRPAEIKFRDRGALKPQQLATAKPSQSRNARPSQARSLQSRPAQVKASSQLRPAQVRSSSHARPAQVRSASQARPAQVRSAQVRSASQSRPSQVRASSQARPSQARGNPARTAHSGGSGSNKAASNSNGKHGSHSRQRR